VGVDRAQSTHPSCSGGGVVRTACKGAQGICPPNLLWGCKAVTSPKLGWLQHDCCLFRVDRHTSLYVENTEQTANMLQATLA
jgi:hypothetical protein